ncbi:terpene synthase family protein [Streptomyces wuyuanensis]|uniref:terpene synthase family protein n=1 Tax=Streptomyces wuyuanensis TaxID=1196353 RepID=UPI003449A954
MTRTSTVPSKSSTRSFRLPGGSAERTPTLNDRSHQVGAAATEWATTWPHIRIPRIPSLVSLLTTAAPFASTAALTTQVRATLWVFAVDDYFDSSNAALPELRDFATSCSTVLRGRQPRSSTPLLDNLVEIRAEVARYPLFQSLAELWGDGINHMLSGMIDEAQWAHEYLSGGARALPSLDCYMRSAYRTIGALPHARTVLITLGDSSTTRHVPFLVSLEKEASLVVRLANDLRSEAKEAREGTINAVVILEQQGRLRGMTPSAALRAARQTVQEQLDHHLACCQQLGRHPVTATGQPEAVISSTASLTASFYQKGDFLPGED